MEGSNGTFVGNPGKLGMETTDIPDDVMLSRVDADVSEVVLIGCGTEPDVTIVVDALVDVLADEVVADLPGGTWCGLSVVLAGGAEPVTLEGTLTDDSTFHVVLDPGELTVVDQFVVSGNLITMVLPISFFESAGLGDYEDGDGAEVGASDGLSKDWSEDLAGTVNIAWGVPDLDAGQGGRDDEDGMFSDSSACACTNGPTGLVPWLPLLGAGLVAIRRRRRGTGS